MIKLPLSFGAALAISLCCSSSIPLPRAKSATKSLFLPYSSPPCPSAIATDLLSVLGSKNDASAVDKMEATRIWSCLRFLVPFSTEILKIRSDPRSNRFHAEDSGFSRGRMEIRRRSLREEDERIRWPPEPVMELARLAVDSGGDPAAIQAALDPAVLKIPDVEGLEEDKCQLTRTPYGRRFINEGLNAYLAFLFELISDRSPMIGLNINLSRYDLFHGHIFLAPDTGRLGILFHAREYPAYEKNIFPINMGYCQRGSCLAYDDSMNLRNILWLAPLPCNRTKGWLAPGVLVALDAHPGGIIYDCLVPEYVNYVRTIYEDDLGYNVADVNYFNIADTPSSRRIFIC
ncbi:T-box protein [Wolffia australiana]